MKEENDAKLDFFKAFNSCQGALDPVKADSKNDHFGNRYPSLAAVMDAVKPFIESGFSFIHEGVEVGGKPYLKTSLVYGGYERVSLWPVVDDGNSQHLASSLTYGKRYSISGLTGLVIDADDDGNAASGNKTATREPASYAAKKAAAVAAVTAPVSTDGAASSVTFVPSTVKFVEGKGKGAGKTFCEIFSPAGIKYGGNESQGELAEAARTKGQEVTVIYKRVGNYYNIIPNGVKFLGPKVEEEEIAEVPF